MKENAISLVLGGHGFIGRHVCRLLARSGITVYGIGHGKWMNDEHMEWGITEWIEGDIALETLSKLAKCIKINSIFHCGGGGAVGNSYSAPFQDYYRSVASTAEVLEFARVLGPDGPRVIIASSAAVYGDQGEVDLLETSVRSPVSPYGFNKLIAENLSDSYSRFFSVPISIVRLFSVYGEGLQKQLLWDACHKFKKGESTFFGTGNELRDWLHVDDAAALLVAAAKTNQSNFEIYNGGGEKAAIRDVLLQISSHFEKIDCLTFSGTVHKGNPGHLTSNSGRAQRQLGWIPRVSLHDGLQRYVKWFKARG